MTGPAPGAVEGERGFTFLEVLVVVGIMAVLFTISIQLTHWIAPESELNATARDLASTIEEGRNEAVISGRRVWLEFDLGQTSSADQFYRTIKDPEPGHERDAERDESVLLVHKWALLQHQIRIEAIFIGDQEPARSGRTIIPIDPNGTLPSHLIRLHAPEFGDQGGWCCIRVAGLLGRTQVITHRVEPELLREDTF